MAKLRSVSTSFWSDTWVEELSPLEKLLYLYLITNDKTNMLGIYESSIKRISNETDIPKEKVSKALEGFEKIGKVKHVDGKYIVLVNFIKYQNYNTNMKKSAIEIHNGLPKELKLNGMDICKSNPLEGFESLCNHYGMVPKVEVEVEEEEEVETEVEVKDTIEDRKARFKESLYPFVSKYSKSIVKDFFEYWSEHGDRDKKMRFEKQTSFSTSRRLGTWKRNDKSSGEDNGRYIKTEITDYEWE